MTERKAILARINSVPSMPSVVMELRKYLNDPDVSFDRLAKLIEVDPGLTVNVLQLANSAYFGWTRTISSVKDAITRLGTNRVFQMVLCMSVAPMVRKTAMSPVLSLTSMISPVMMLSAATATIRRRISRITLRSV